MKLESISSADRMVSDDAQALLAALGEPAALVGFDGRVVSSSPQLRRLLQDNPEGRQLSDYHSGDGAALARYIHRCFGSGSSLIGSIHLPFEQPPARFRLRGSRVALSGGVAVLLRFDRIDEERFGALNRKVLELKQDVAERQHTQALLEETVRERELLLRELQHRVKNNMHMLGGLLQGAEREASTPEAKLALREVASRVSAISSVQQLLYSSDDLEVIDSHALVEAVVQGIRALVREEVSIKTDCDHLPLDFRAAMPIALVANELITNAAKHGGPYRGRAEIGVRLSASAGKLRLEVTDNGHGFELKETSKRASGIGLVRGLLRQLGGAFSVEGDGATCVASLPLSQAVAEGERDDWHH